MLKFKKTQKMRGITLMETLLSLAIGGLVIVSSVQGVVTYNENVKIQASSALLKKMQKAADLYAEDNFDQLVANAPQQLPVTVLDPYLGSTILRDPFRADYRLGTRTYTYQTPDPATGGVTTQDALQLLVIAQDGNSHLADSPSVRIDVANTAGTDAGYISPFDDLCNDASGTSMPAGTLCGAFGSYAFNTSQFPGLNGNSRYAALVTKGDSSVYGDQLYRYDFGDPELNTMHTTLNMDGNDIINATRVRDVEHLEMTGPRARITNDSGELSVSSLGNLFLGTDSNEIVLNGRTAADSVRITSPSQTVQIGTADNDLVSGDLATVTGIPSEQVAIGSGDILTGRLYGDEARVNEVNSLFKRDWDPLRLQKFERGEVIIGDRARYTPPGGESGLRSASYELSDGMLTTGVVKTQDVTCADCGGSLSEILPRWRHMGTYFIPNSNAHIVPKPSCGITRRDEINRNAAGDEAAVVNRANMSPDHHDPRYTAKILLLPKHMAAEDQENMGGFDIEFLAQDQTNQWRVTVQKRLARVEAFAMTYCVFLGGDPDPTYTGYRDTRVPRPGGSWLELE